LRLSLVGGGSDLRYFYEINGGMSLGLAINYFNYIFFTNSKNNTNHIISDKENIETNNYEAIKDTLIRDICIKYKLINKKIFIFSDLPYGSGLGSSSAMCVGIINGINKIHNLNLNKQELAERAFDIEEMATGSTIGKQDHYMSSFGNINLFKYNKDSTTDIENINISKENIKEFESHLLLIKIGSFRNASEILHDQKNNLISSKKKFENMNKLLSFVEPAKKCLINSDYKGLGKIISETWEIKKTFSKLISNKKIDELYSYLISMGIYGGKLLGAGSSGYFLAICDNKAKSKIINKLNDNDLLNININFNGSERLN
jgi:D-glycero-alpha-D-manno-heptose-7-phosphate kinase